MPVGPPQPSSARCRGPYSTSAAFVMHVALPGAPTSSLPRPRSTLGPSSWMRSAAACVASRDKERKQRGRSLPQIGTGPLTVACLRPVYTPPKTAKSSATLRDLVDRGVSLPARSSSRPTTTVHSKPPSHQTPRSNSRASSTSRSRRQALYPRRHAPRRQRVGQRRTAAPGSPESGRIFGSRGFSNSGGLADP